MPEVIVSIVTVRGGQANVPIYVQTVVLVACVVTVVTVILVMPAGAAPQSIRLGFGDPICDLPLVYLHPRASL